MIPGAANAGEDGAIDFGRGEGGAAAAGEDGVTGFGREGGERERGGCLWGREERRGKCGGVRG